MGQSPVTPPSPTQYNDLLFHGGTVEHHPAVYIVFWGTEWQKGFTTSSTSPAATYSGAAAQNYIKAFFANVGGSAWNGTQTEYTDPNSWPTQDGWNDYQTSENGDKCAYFQLQNITLGHNSFAVQPMWSNDANGGTGGTGGCTVARGHRAGRRAFAGSVDETNDGGR